MKKKILLIIIMIFGLFLVSACGNPHKDEPQYKIYELAVEAGFEGTYEEWLASVKGEDGKSAYELYLEKHPDYKGTEEEWLDDLVNDRLGNKEEVTYTIKFDSDGGSEVEDQKVKELTRVKKPTDPVKKGFIFKGWYIGDEKVLFSQYLVLEDVTLKAKWELEKLEIVCQNDFSTFIVGKEIKLDFKVTNIENYDEFTYEVDDPNIARIENGYIIGQHIGECNLKATNKIKPDDFLVVNIKVLDDKPLSIEIVPDNNKTTIFCEQSLKLNVKCFPEYTNYKNVKWSVNNQRLATISKDGILTADVIEGDVIVTAVIENNKTATIKINIKQIDYPNLNGYNISIAQAQHALSQFDPFNPSYMGLDKRAKQEAWREVEQLFNCKITIDPYPASAGWGSSRWNYILNSAKQETADFDFYTIPDTKIPTFADKNAILDLTDFYNKHGKAIIDKTFIESSSYNSKVYGLSEDKNNIFSVMYYNIGLFEELKKTDPTLVEPAQLFNEGKWTYTTFINYLEKVQNIMHEKYGEKAKPNGINQDYFAAAGYDAFYYSGLCQNDGDPVANKKTNKISLDTKHRQEAADIVKMMYTKGYASKNQNIDNNVVEWNRQRALFNTGDLWFVNNETRWAPQLWGQDTRYGYVPWPMPDDMTLNDYKVAVGGTSLWVMANFRNYDKFGPDCNAENIYWAVCELIRKTNKYMFEHSDITKEEATVSMAKRYAHSKASQQAFITIQNFLDEGRGYFDPMCVNDNPLQPIYGPSNYTGLKKTVSGYINGQYKTWSDAIKDLVPFLENRLKKIA